MGASKQTKLFFMEHELVIKDSRGTICIKVVLVVFSFGSTDRNGNKFRYDVSVMRKAPGKRKNIFVEEFFASQEEIQQAKNELWQLLKP